jgi:hypothetical protein
MPRGVTKVGVGGGSPSPERQWRASPGRRSPGRGDSVALRLEAASPAAMVSVRPRSVSTHHGILIVR